MQNKITTGRQLLAVLCGGFFGTVTRYLLSLLLQQAWERNWPYDILLINITGALLIALFSTLADTTTLIGPTRRLFLVTGFLGAYTTFSSLALGAVNLIDGGETLSAFLYLLLSAFGGLLAVGVGLRLGQWCTKRLKTYQVPLPVWFQQEEEAGRGRKGL